MDDLKTRLLERAASARKEGDRTAHIDADHFEDAARELSKLEKLLKISRAVRKAALAANTALHEDAEDLREALAQCKRNAEATAMVPSAVIVTIVDNALAASLEADA